MVKKHLENSKSKHENALAILKLWEEELKIKYEVNEDTVNTIEKIDNPKIIDSKYQNRKN